jgi:hypothetical protein
MEYKILAKSLFSMSTCPIHKLIMAVPTEEQNIGEEEDKKGDKRAAPMNGYTVIQVQNI